MRRLYMRLLDIFRKKKKTAEEVEKVEKVRSPFKRKLGKKIKLARVEMDMIQSDLAKAMGTMQKTISRWETGQSAPRLKNLLKIAVALNKPLRYFRDN